MRIVHIELRDRMKALSLKREFLYYFSKDSMEGARQQLYRPCICATRHVDLHSTTELMRIIHSPVVLYRPAK